MASEIKVDTISEKTSAGGVTIDGLLIKDGGISGDVSLIGTTPTFTIGDAGAEDAALVFDGNAKDFYVALDDSADKLVIGEGSTVGTNSILTITDDSVTIGDAAAVDTKIVFDGNAKDFYVALDDSADKLVIGEGSTVGTNSILTITDDSVTIGDAAAVDTKIVFDGNAQDYYVGLDDSADTLAIGLGSTVGTTPAITINSSQVATFAQNPVFPDGGVAVADLDIDGATDIGAAVVDADLFIIDDGAGGTNRKVTASRLKTYASGSFKGTESMFNVVKTSAQTLDHDTITILAWQTAYVNVGSDFDLTNNKYVCPSDGKYLFSWNCYLSAEADSNYLMGGIYLYKGSSHDISGENTQAQTSFTDFRANYPRAFGVTGSSIVDCSASDEITVRAFIQHTGSADTSACSNYYTHFQGVKLTD